MLADWKCDIACYSETWLQPNSTTDSILQIRGFSLFRQDRVHRTHGGLMVYVDSRIRTHRRSDLEVRDIECIALELSLPDRGKFLLFFCYRPPDHSPEHFFDCLSERLSLATNHSALFLLGDFNAKHPRWDSSSAPNAAGRRMCALCDEFSLTQCVELPTRYSADGKTSTVLDLFTTDRTDLVSDIIVSDPVSDHCCVTTKLNVTVPICLRNEKRYLFDYDKADWEGLRASLYKTPLLQAIQGTDDINTAWKVWKNIICEAIYKHVPTRVVVSRPGNKVWMSSHLHLISRQKHRLFKRAVASKQEEHWLRYTSYRNYCNSEFQKAKTSYLIHARKRLEHEIEGSHRWWQHAKGLSKISTPGLLIPDLEQDDELATTPEEKADLLAQFFSTQCSDPDVVSPYEAGAPYPLPADHPTFEFPPISEQAVLKRLQNLSVYKSSGCRTISNRVLKETAPFVANSLTYLYNLSLNTGIFPEEWKAALITPIYKQRGQPQNPTNYRPISLLPAVGKTLDAIQSKVLCSYLLKNSLVSDHQFGFLPGRSTVHQLIYIIGKWTKALDSGNNVASVFLDFQKAFDKVWHPGLLHKLAKAGVMPHSLAWLKDYLSQRTLSVRIGSSTSSPYPITAGVPQGSHLGPILFAVFINDLATTATSCTELYADDALLYDIFRRSESLNGLACLQDGVSSAATWARTWRGRFAPPKTELLPIGRAIVETCAAMLSPVQLEDEEIDVVQHHKHLGVYLSTDLRWERHMEYVISNAKKRSGLLRHMSKDLPHTVVEKLYIYFVRPALEYASPVWDAAISAGHALALERIQASIGRCILQASWTTPKVELFRALNWPALRWRRTVASVVLLQQLLKTRPAFLSSFLFPFAKSLSSHNLRKPKQLVLPTASSKRHLHTFFYHASLLWNSLPNSTQQIQDTHAFKAAVERHWATHTFFASYSIPL